MKQEYEYVDEALAAYQRERPVTISKIEEYIWRRGFSAGWYAKGKQQESEKKGT